jgi:Mg/Co/Ni transporter MgtE
MLASLKKVKEPTSEEVRGDVYVVNPSAELIEGVSARQLLTHEVKTN